MKQTLSPNQGIKRGVLWMWTLISGITVANLYYSQPVLNKIATELNISELTANNISIATQLGYASGLLFIVPLGDLFKATKILTVSFISLIISLAITAVSTHLYTLIITSFIIGACSVMPHIFIPMASQFSKPQRKTQNVGMLLSGLLTGILTSRVISGFVGEHFSWRVMYGIATLSSLLCLLAIWFYMPKSSQNFSGSYGSLMKSLYTIAKENKLLQNVSLRAALCFASFQGMWAMLAFKMCSEPFYANNDIIGLLGFCGIVGAITASSVGGAVNKLGARNFHFIGCFIIVLSWTIMWIFQNSYVGFITGILLIDAGIQCIQLSNQSKALSLLPSAANRVNTIFMTSFFLGASFGTFIAGVCWANWKWNGVVIAGIVLTLLSFIITIGYKKND